MFMVDSGVIMNEELVKKIEKYTVLASEIILNKFLRPVLFKAIALK